jgi:hypothetical protein
MTQQPTVPPDSHAPAGSRRGFKKASWALAALALAALAAVGLVFLGPRLVDLFKPPVPTPQCVQPTLTLGTQKFSIQSLARAADGSVTVPPAAGEDLAYWVEGTNATFVFVLGQAALPRLQNASLKVGDDITIVWADCGKEDYVVSAVEPGRADAAALFDQSIPGMRVFAQSSASGEGIIIHGARPENPTAAVTPELTAVGATQAEVSFLDNAISADGKTLHISVAIKNTGSTPIMLAETDISLAPGDGAEMPPASVTPALPQPIIPGESQTFTIIFAYDGAKVEVFKLLDFSMEFYY